MQTLHGRTAIVTGAASAAGIGYATARRLAQSGATVMLTDVAEPVESRARELCDEGFQACAQIHDVSSEADWQRVCEETMRRTGGIDILVNNAGIAVLGSISDLSLEDWHRQMAVNLTSTFLGCQQLVRRWRDARRGGVIVNVSSIAGLVGMPGTTPYAASKGGVRLLSKALALECAREGIRVNSVHPGMIQTDIQASSSHDNPEAAKALANSIPMGRLGEPDDIAAMIAFLVSDEAGYITGAEFVVDGGVTAQ